MPPEPEVVVAPADAKVLIGSLADRSMLFLKEKFFPLPELFGSRGRLWVRRFRGVTLRYSA